MSEQSISQLVEEAEGRLQAVAIDQGMRLLDQRWDNYFVPAN